LPPPALSPPNMPYITFFILHAGQESSAQPEASCAPQFRHVVESVIASEWLLLVQTRLRLSVPRNSKQAHRTETGI